MTLNRRYYHNPSMNRRTGGGIVAVIGVGTNTRERGYGRERRGGAYHRRDRFYRRGVDTRLCDPVGDDRDRDRYRYNYDGGR